MRVRAKSQILELFIPLATGHVPNRGPDTNEASEALARSEERMHFFSYQKTLEKALHTAREKKG